MGKKKEARRQARGLGRSPRSLLGLKRLPRSEGEKHYRNNHPEKPEKESYFTTTGKNNPPPAPLLLPLPRDRLAVRPSSPSVTVVDLTWKTFPVKLLMTCEMFFLFEVRGSKPENNSPQASFRDLFCLVFRAKSMQLVYQYARNVSRNVSRK